MQISNIKIVVAFLILMPAITFAQQSDITVNKGNNAKRMKVFKKVVSGKEHPNEKILTLGGF